jgi:EAL domain-containing protein (putative c-di-GMP-specific phosphodiesterase class I)
MVEATPAPSALASSPRKQVQTEKLAVSGLAEMQPIFSPSIKLRAKAPDVYFAEPSFQPQVGEKVAYAALLGQLRSGSARFRLDYWNLGQAILRVSVGKGIFDNEAWYRRLLGLLTAAPELARRLVVAFNYQDCMANIRHFGRVAKLLHGAGVQLGVDQLLDDARLLAFIRAVKPAFVRLAPVGNARRLHRLVHQLNETGCKVIVTDVNDATVLSFVCATSAAYLQGRVVRRNN